MEIQYYNIATQIVLYVKWNICLDFHNVTTIRINIRYKNSHLQGTVDGDSIIKDRLKITQLQIWVCLPDVKNI